MSEHNVSSIPGGPPIDISRTIDELCDAFDLDKTFVSQIVFEPSVLTFTILDINDEGKKFIGDDGEVATHEKSYRVTT